MKVKETKVWKRDDVRIECIKNNWYNSGSFDAYEHMLDYVEKHSPTNNNLLKIATDIYNHSTADDSVEYIMYCLANFVVRSFFNIT